MTGEKFNQIFISLLQESGDGEYVSVTRNTKQVISITAPKGPCKLLVAKI